MPAATQIELFLGPLVDPTTGSLCNGYTAYFYDSGTTTPRNVWTEPAMTNPFTSYVLDGAGSAALFGSGLYTIVIKNLDGTAVLTRNGVKILAY